MIGHNSNEADAGLYLLDEFLSYPGLTQEHLDCLKRVGVSTAARIRAGGLAVPRVVPAGQLYVPCPTGDPMFAIPVYDGQAPSFDNPDLSAALIDILAFRLEEPTIWWLRNGAPHLVLGRNHLITAMLDGTAVQLHSTPLEWLQAGCEGVCLLDLADSYQEAVRTRVHLTDLEAV